MDATEHQFQQALQQHSAGNIDAAKQAYEALLSHSEHAGALSNLGQIYRLQGNSEKAIDLQRRACKTVDATPEMHFNLGNALRQAERLDEARQAYETAIQLKPDFPLAFVAMAIVVQHTVGYAQAARYFQQALDLDQSLWRAWQGRAEATLQTGAPEEALADLNKAAELAPQQLSVWRLLAQTLAAQGDLGAVQQQQLIRACQRWADLDKNVTQPLAEIANRCWEAKRHELSINALREAAKRDPDDAAILSTLAFRLSEVHHVTEALEYSQRALAVMPENKDMQALPAKLMLLAGDATGATKVLGDLYQQDATAAYEGRNWLFSSLYDETLKAERVTARHRRVASAWSGSAHRSTRKARDGADRRIAFLSPDLAGDHPVAQFIEPVLASFREQGQTVFVYSTTDKEDAVKQRMQTMTTEWHDVAELDDAGLAELISEHEVDVLIDLAGHTKGGRLSVFGYRPAPIQACWLGYPYTTGHPGCDYLLVDRIVCPPVYSGLYTEQLRYLPDCVFPVPKLPDEVPVGCPDGPLTFGNFGALQKITPKTYALWLRVLEALPDSRLILKNGSFADTRIKEQFARRLIDDGIGACRFELLPPTAFNHMLGEYDKVDMVLDTLAYNGGTTAFHALWMGVPTLTLPGDKFCNRMGASIMVTYSDAPMSVADEKSYIAMACEVQRNLTAFRQQRAQRRHRLMNSKNYTALNRFLKWGAAE